MTAPRKASRRPADPVLAMLKAMEIRVVPTFQQRGAGETHAVQVIRRLVKQHGQDHAVLTLRSIAETGENSAHLTSFVIWGVSDVIAAHPEWANSGGKWLEALDQINMGAIVERARGNRQAVPLRAAVSTGLFVRLLPIFAANEQARQEQAKQQRQQGRPAKPPLGKRALWKARADAGVTQGTTHTTAQPGAVAPPRTVGHHAKTRHDVASTARAARCAR